MDYQVPVFQDTKPLIAIVRQVEETPKPKKIEPRKYRVRKGDTLVRIAKAHKTSWRRLWNKNLNIKHPDKIKPGMRLIVPLKSEKLKARKVPNIVRSARIRAAGTPLTSVHTANSSPTGTGGYSNSAPVSYGLRSGYYPGNTYTPGQCTYGVKMWRPGIPNGWGNAYEWWASAGAMGWPRGTEPRVGAVAVTSNGGGHVGLVTAVHSNGTVTFKDMNGNYVPWQVDYRTIPKYSYRYIY